MSHENSISSDGARAQEELVEFWSRRYSEVKHELDYFKNMFGVGSEPTVLPEPPKSAKSEGFDELFNFVREEAARRQAADVELRSLLASGSASYADHLNLLAEEKDDLATRLQKSQDEQSALSKQLRTIQTHVAALATETRQWRRKRIAQLFPEPQPPSFLDATFETTYLNFGDPDSFMRLVPNDPVLRSRRIVFYPRPPNALPMDVSSIARSGYWFFPVVVSEHEVFELIVESEQNQWTYLGTYRTASLPGYEMKLSEWLCLDEETRAGHCSRAREHARAQLPVACRGESLDVRRFYDTGEWTVLCYSLHCVGFNKSFYLGIQSVARSQVAVASHATAQQPPSTRV
ncbi:uncharacterized protein LAESUDRAFT_729036 [Laetiporus sulphureus 93-53]|uniref:DUF6697 domain-containing protein n=1 Tax=Laetiporus sulphureus 93-53 TaxID=1314785 RepID=A0A165CUR5_9APHY|nr:uncharacterized protein LAESUDRAFT_729036 [Laetiporus sulphureus 93-53]KZT03464.1 hypothetical protein LAESUDRAFT_729036 [Laetiporus sulphureus 93-53]